MSKKIENQNDQNLEESGVMNGTIWKVIAHGPDQVEELFNRHKLGEYIVPVKENIEALKESARVIEKAKEIEGHDYVRNELPIEVKKIKEHNDKVRASQQYNSEFNSKTWKVIAHGPEQVEEAFKEHGMDKYMKPSTENLEALKESAKKFAEAKLASPAAYPTEKLANEIKDIKKNYVDPRKRPLPIEQKSKGGQGMGM